MSWVTNAVLAYCIEAGDDVGADERWLVSRLPDINAFFGRERGFRPVPGDSVGGTKHLEINLLTAAFNGIDEEGFVEHLKSLEWDRPETVQLFLWGEDEDGFRVIRVFAVKEQP